MSILEIYDSLLRILLIIVVFSSGVATYSYWTLVFYLYKHNKKRWNKLIGLPFWKLYLFVPSLTVLFSSKFLRYISSDLDNEIRSVRISKKGVEYGIIFAVISLIILFILLIFDYQR